MKFHRQVSQVKFGKRISFYSWQTIFFELISWWCIIKGGGPYLHFSFDWFIVVRGGNYCVINFVSHVEIVVIKIQSNNLNTTSTTTKYDKQDPTEGEIMMKILPLNNLFCQFGSLTSLNLKAILCRIQNRCKSNLTIFKLYVFLETILAILLGQSRFRKDHLWFPPLHCPVARLWTIVK